MSARPGNMSLQTTDCCQRILVIDDDPLIATLVKVSLAAHGYQILATCDSLQALDLVRARLPDAVLLDVMMPGLDGFEVLYRLRKFSSVPVIMLTARSDEQDKVFGLKLGADAYVTKPFSSRELAARLRAVLRRTQWPTPPRWTGLQIDASLSVDFNHHEVVVKGRVIKLCLTEFRLLYHLIENAGWTVPHEQLLTKVWGYARHGNSQLLRTYINYLRKKIEADPAHPRYIQTARGIGYRFLDYPPPDDPSTGTSSR